LRHFAHPDHGFYNGFAGSEIAAGTLPLGLQNVAAHGIVGRGLLVDVARYRESLGRPIDHANSEQIPVSELVATLEWQDSEARPGDILLLRFGWIGWYRKAARPAGSPLVSAGLAPREETAAWLWDHQFAVAAADNPALESWPASGAGEVTTRAEQEGRLATSSHTGMLHRILIPLLGLTIGELWDLDALSEACWERGRYEALIVAEPLNITGGVGSPANAIAVI
jgi:kynurenine formamidase